MQNIIILLAFDEMPELNEIDIENAYFRMELKTMSFGYVKNKKPYLETMKDYFDVIKSF